VNIASPGWDRPGVAGRWADRPTITYSPLTSLAERGTSPAAPLIIVGAGG